MRDQLGHPKLQPNMPSGLVPSAGERGVWWEKARTSRHAALLSTSRTGRGVQEDG